MPEDAAAAQVDGAILAHRPLAVGPPVEREKFSVVAIGASAGGLAACTKLVAALADGHGMAFILVQHLEPTHKSMMVDLLAGHTTMTVQQATDGMRPEPGHLYIIPPGSYLAVEDGALALSRPPVRHGARLPFDFLLRSLAAEYGDRAICIVLSGTGADGSIGLQAVKQHGGFVITQDPGEAAYGGMPENAIATGLVDAVLPVARMAAALTRHDIRTPRIMAPPERASGEQRDALGAGQIIEFLRSGTAHDFSLYKPGTLLRRIERRMTMAGIGTGDMTRYLTLLQHSRPELDLLAKDLLINVTGFFRDPEVFGFLADHVVPDLIRRAADRPLRIWVAGCSTGEEAYSLAILFQEAIAAASVHVRLQMFASDLDPDAVAIAREGHYPAAIAADVSPERLAKFFTKDEHGYQVDAALRGMIVFTVQNVLADPPFSRLDMVSCRNLLIYLRPEAQARILSLFHFALHQGGILLLGASETIGNFDGVFAPVAKMERVFRHLVRSRPGEVDFSLDEAGVAGGLTRPGASRAPSRQTALAELCRRTVLETHVPATVLINTRHECLFSLGPTERYLNVPPGHSTHDLLAMVRPAIRTKLRAAIQLASQGSATLVVKTGPLGEDPPFAMSVQPLRHDGEELLLICFSDDPAPANRENPAVPIADLPRVVELEAELETVRTELQAAIRRLELSGEDQKAINQEALSVNEEYQSTNEELLTSKEELQALNEELTALNSQLQETLECQRTTSNDLQNILYSTDLATLFLDGELRIRFFTPATRSLFHVIAGDIGRPLADLHALSTDPALLDDARTMLRTLAPSEREIEGQDGAWFIRRILPYRTHDNGVAGVVITFADITERKHAAWALEAAKREAEQATAAKSRFLAAASHDLRQPLQTLKLVQGLLTKKAEGPAMQKLVGMLDPTLSAMSAMLNTLLDMNQIDAGVIRAEKIDFSVADLLCRLRDEFAYHADARGLSLHVVPCGLMVHSDPRLLEQMLRNLISNALKYTRHGRLLLGCRRHGACVSIQVWDTGIGIAADELEKIFEEYHQVDNAARERSFGLGLGLAVVKRLGDLLGHQVTVRSRQGHGSVFAIDVACAVPHAPTALPDPAAGDAGGSPHRAGTILVIDDDPDLRAALELLLTDEGHHVITAADGKAALSLVARGAVRPEMILSDYNLPNGPNGLATAGMLRERLHRHIPVIILTGDIAAETKRHIAERDCIQLQKPMKPALLLAAVRNLLPALVATPRIAPWPVVTQAGPPVIYVIDDDRNIRDGIRRLLEADGRVVIDFPTCEAFLAAYRPGRDAVLLVDAFLPGMHGIELLQRLAAEGQTIPAIIITGSSDVPIALQAMKAGAADFIEKPIGGPELLASIDRALEQYNDTGKLSAWRQTAAHNIAGLTDRQRQIMDMVLAGHPSKNIAADLAISQRTVENHRASIMKRTGSKSLPELARIALAASVVRLGQGAALDPLKA